MSQQHPTMSCDGNGPCASRNRHCDKCDPAEVAPTPDEGAGEACPTPEFHATHYYCPSCPWVADDAPVSEAENDDLKRQRAIAWHQNVCPPCVEGDHANCTGACDSSCCAVADLETELEMSEQALARANAVIERVGAWLNEHERVRDADADGWADLRAILEGNGA